MLSRRSFLAATGASLAGAALSQAQEPSQAEKAAGGGDDRSGTTARTPGTWPSGSSPAIRVEGSWHRPPIEVVSAYVDQLPEERPEPQAARGVRLHDLPDGRRGAALRRRQAGGRCGADHRRARRLPEQRDRPEAVPALRVLQAGRRGLSRRTAAPRRSSTTSTCRGSGSGRRRWWTRPAR